jgi:hypothetical protein
MQLANKWQHHLKEALARVLVEFGGYDAGISMATVKPSSPNI